MGKRQIVARFDGGQLSSDGGGLLLREVERRTGLLRQFAACFRDYRNPMLVE
ncbi:MAG: transposase, partial [Thermoanaerobaculia bacterium]